MSFLARWSLFPLLGMLAAVGCSAGGSPGAPGAAVKDTGGPSADTPVEPQVCDVCSTEYSGSPPKAGFDCIKTLDAELLEVDGLTPVKGALVQSCSKTFCATGETDTSGKVHIVPCAYVEQPVFKVFGFVNFASFSISMRNPQDTFSFPKVPMVRIPKTGIALTPGTSQVLTMAGVTVETGAGSKNVQPDVFAPYDDFRATLVPKVPPQMAAGIGLELFYSLGPQNTLFDPPAKLTIPNAKGWTAGTAVEVYQLNFDQVAGLPVKMGEWWKVATARVSDDGKTVVTDPGQGLTMLTMIGVRKKP